MNDVRGSGPLSVALEQVHHDVMDAVAAGVAVERRDAPSNVLRPSFDHPLDAQVGRGRLVQEALDVIRSNDRSALGCAGPRLRRRSGDDRARRRVHHIEPGAADLPP